MPKRSKNNFIEKEIKIMNYIDEISLNLSKIYLDNSDREFNMISCELVKHSNYIIKHNNSTIKLRKYYSQKGKVNDYELIIKTKTNNLEKEFKERMENQEKISKNTYSMLESLITSELMGTYKKYTMKKIRYTFKEFIVDVCNVKNGKEKIPTYIEIELRNNNLTLNDVKKFLKKVVPEIKSSKLDFSTKSFHNLK